MRLLVATQFPPDAPGGGPAVIRQLIRGFPPHELHWWSAFPLRGARPGWVASHSHPWYHPKLYPERKMPRLRAWVMEHLWSPVAAASLRQCIGASAPDVVWAIPHNWSIPALHAALMPMKERLHVTMQDFVDVHRNPERFGAARCRRMAVMAEELYRRAETRDATSHPMLESLRAATGAAGEQMVHQGLEPEDFAFLESAPSRPADPIRIVYAGTVLAEEAFAWFAGVLEEIRPHLDRPVILDFYGANSYADRPWFRSGWMREHGNLSDREVVEALRGCTWGFIPMHFEDKDARYNRYSFPTKFITYLAAGLPVIAVGHPESSVMRLAGGYRLGLCEDGATLGTFAARLREALGHPDPFAGHRDEILRCARENFDAEKMRTVLWSCLSGVRTGQARARP
jgi:glycosyltransferase involved in cell wall biosynthesis